MAKNRNRETLYSPFDEIGSMSKVAVVANYWAEAANYRAEEARKNPLPDTFGYRENITEPNKFILSVIERYKPDAPEEFIKRVIVNLNKINNDEELSKAVGREHFAQTVACLIKYEQLCNITKLIETDDGLEEVWEDKEEWMSPDKMERLLIGLGAPPSVAEMARNMYTNSRPMGTLCNEVGTPCLNHKVKRMRKELAPPEVMQLISADKTLIDIENREKELNNIRARVTSFIQAYNRFIKYNPIKVNNGAYKNYIIFPSTCTSFIERLGKKLCNEVSKYYSKQSVEFDDSLWSQQTNMWILNHPEKIKELYEEKLDSYLDQARKIKEDIAGRQQFVERVYNKNKFN